MQSDESDRTRSGRETARRRGQFMLMTLVPLFVSGPSRHMPAMLGLSADFWHGVVIGLALLIGLSGLLLMLRDHHAGSAI